MQDHRSRISAVILLVGLSACDPGDLPFSAQTRTQSAAPAHEHTVAAPNLDSRFAEVARSVPGFGGMFLDTATSHLNVYLYDAAARGSAVAAIRRAFPEPQLANAPVSVLPGRYTWGELAAWRAQVDAFLTVPGVYHTDVDERRNQIRIGVQNEAARSRIASELEQLRVPSGAAMIEIIPEFRPIRTIRDPASNLEGGLQIFNPVAASGPLECTAAFNVQYNGYYGFMTASHCTTVESEVNNTPFYQPDQTTGRYLGSEAADPGWFFFGGETRGRWLCPRGARCRLSDAAVIRHETNAFGYGVIARTTLAGTTPTATGSIMIDDSSPTMIINGEASAVAGTSVGKIGRTTGWTIGSVLQTCSHRVSTAADGSPFILMCQDVVAARAEGGDSGAPVFAASLTGATLYGVVWGSGYPDRAEFVYSPIRNIQDEFGVIAWR